MSGDAVTIKSEARGSHWVAWVVRPDGQAAGPVLMVGQTREEAESRLRAWWEAQRS